VNAAESGEAGAAEHVGEDCFRLIVGGVGHCNSVEKPLGDQAFTEGVTGAAGSILKIGVLPSCFGGDVFTRGKELQVVTRGEFGNELFVGVRSFAAELMIEMNDRENEAKLFSEFEEEKKKGHGVGATGNGHADAGTGTEERISRQRGQEMGSRGFPARRFAGRLFLGHEVLPVS
jgi:hypothetical protein